MDKMKLVEAANEMDTEKKQQMILNLESLLENSKEESKLIKEHLCNDLNMLAKENEKLEQCIRDLKMSAAEMSEKNLVLENEICKLKERPQLIVSENNSTMQDLMKQNKNLKDRNDELEYFFINKNERGRARKRGRRTSSVSKSLKRRNRHSKKEG